MNGELCCLTGVCCPPLSARRQRALVKFMVENGVGQAKAEQSVAKLFMDARQMFSADVQQHLVEHSA